MQAEMLFRDPLSETAIFPLSTEAVSTCIIMEDETERFSQFSECGETHGGGLPGPQ
jgi:hypothetical protein